ncbi:MAG: hypothetical protein OWV35_09690 [Firmicutes bacterium]|nr:hypothetical protein [Bacillota bacterium]
MRGTSRWWVLMAGLGLGLGIVRAALGPLHSNVVVSVIADLLAAVIVVLAGRELRRHAGHFALAGGGLGVVYAALASWPIWLVHLNRAQVRALLISRVHATPSDVLVTRTMHLLNAPAAHGLSYVGTLLVGFLIGLILGAVGGWTTRPGEPSRAV